MTKEISYGLRVLGSSLQAHGVLEYWSAGVLGCSDILVAFATGRLDHKTHPECLTWCRPAPGTDSRLAELDLTPVTPTVIGRTG